MKTSLIRTVVAIGLLVSLHGAIVAQEVTLLEAIDLAMSNNLGIRSEIITTEQKRLVAESWWNRFVPQVSARASLVRLNTEQSGSVLVPVSSGLEPIPGASDYVIPQTFDVSRWSLSTALDMSLTLSMQLFPGFELAELDYRSSTLSVEDTRRSVARDVAKQFYRLLLLEEQIGLIEEQIDGAQTRYDQALANFQNGLVDELSVLSAQVALENLRPQLTNLRVAYDSALMAFKNVLGVGLREEMRPAGTIDPPQLALAAADVDRELLTRRIGIQQLRLLDSILAEQYNATAASRLPTVTFGFSVDPSLSNATDPSQGPFETDWFDDDNWNQRSGSFSITVVQPIDPWLPRGQIANQLADLERQREQNAISMQQALNGAEMEVEGLIRSIRAAEETLEALTSNIALAQRAFDLASESYRNGLIDLSQVENAEVELLSAQLQVLEQQNTIMINLLDLEYALGVPLTPVGRSLSSYQDALSLQEEDQ